VRAPPAPHTCTAHAPRRLGWRPADLDTAYLPFLWGQGCQIGFSDPVFQRKFAAAQARPSTEPLWNRIKFMARLLLGTRNIFTMFRIIFNARKIRQAMAWIDVVNSGTYRKWADLKLLRDNWTGPIIIKGVQTVADARQAADAGMNGIIISNHGTPFPPRLILIR
jgi:lactate 2-monooxygenase